MIMFENFDPILMTSLPQAELKDYPSGSIPALAIARSA
jgi:hypothetical protein